MLTNNTAIDVRQTVVSSFAHKTGYWHWPWVANSINLSKIWDKVLYFYVPTPPYVSSIFSFTLLFFSSSSLLVTCCTVVQVKPTNQPAVFSTFEHTKKSAAHYGNWFVYVV